MRWVTRESIKRLKPPAGALRSLRLRLCLFFGLLVLAAWLAAAALAWSETREYVNEFFDTQLMMFAKTLALADFGALSGPARLPGTRSVVRDRRYRGDEDDDALAFAIFARDGELILSDGEKGDHFPFQSRIRGFTDMPVGRHDRVWRIVWLESRTDSFVVAVGQELRYRREMTLDMLREQLAPWLYMLPLLLLGMVVLVGRELAPLRATARNLETREPDDATPVSGEKLPGELRPLIASLNRLFERTGSLLVRERAFIADAAHELRTPLTALRVQAEVAQMADDDPAVRQNALDKLVQGIDRSNRLVEQLLTLSRLEVGRGTPQEAVISLDWRPVLEELLEEYRPLFADRGITLSARLESSRPLCGRPEALRLLLRNLLDNACKYTPHGGEVRVSQQGGILEIANSGPGVPEQYLARLGERFFRPPGQSQPGSGLGLAIAGRAAALLGLRLDLANIPEGFAARLILP